MTIHQLVATIKIPSGFQRLEIQNRQPSAYALTAQRLARVDDDFNIHVWQFIPFQHDGVIYLWDLTPYL